MKKFSYIRVLRGDWQMRLTFLGATGMVTGSCLLLEAGGLRLLVDCGLFQGKDEELNAELFGFDPADLDGVILTHAHIDHSGRLPLLRRQGFTGPIYTHPATADLAKVMLLDSAEIQVADADRANRKAIRAGRPPVEPLYLPADAEALAEQFRPVGYGEKIKIGDRLSVRLEDAGHILGSALVEVVERDGEGRDQRLLISGDIGPPGRPILGDPTDMEKADYLVIESTYGNRLHEPAQFTRTALADTIRTTIQRGGNVVIPAFAVGRTQELLYALRSLVGEGKLPPNLRIALDSPLAIAATKVTTRHSEVFDQAATALLKESADLFDFPGLIMTQTKEESQALNTAAEPMVIIAAGGMCESGRILHHLKHNLWRRESTILFVGYQAEGTLGRRILDGAKQVRIHNDDIAVRAQVESLQGLSAHADRDQLLAWAGMLKHPPRTTYVVHGEDDARQTMAHLLTQMGHHVALPVLGETALLGEEPPARPRKQLVIDSQVAVARGQELALSAQRMSALLHAYQALRKAWYARGPQLAPGQAAELALRAEEALRNLEAMRQLIESLPTGSDQ